MIIQSTHTLSYCALCEHEMVRCAVCNNNCCNAGYGEVDGQNCTTCPEAYDHQDAYWKNKSSVVFALDKRNEHRIQGEQRMKEAGITRYRGEDVEGNDE